MSKSPDIDEFIQNVKDEYETWRLTWANLAETQMTGSSLPGNWSVKDMIAHVTWHEVEMCTMIRSRSFDAGSPLWYLPLDERNAEIFKINHDRSLSDVLKEANEAHMELIALLKTLSDTDLIDPSRFTGMPQDLVPWDVIAGNSYRHYQEHKITLD